MSLALEIFFEKLREVIESPCEGKEAKIAGADG
jgi:hypothetical protein